MYKPSPTRSGWRGVCTAYAQQNEEDTYASPTSRQAARCHPTKPWGQPKGRPEPPLHHTTTARGACCREAVIGDVCLVDLQANPKPISHQPKHNSRVKSIAKDASCRSLMLFDPNRFDDMAPSTDMVGPAKGDSQ